MFVLAAKVSSWHAPCMPQESQAQLALCMPGEWSTSHALRYAREVSNLHVLSACHKSAELHGCRRRLRLQAGQIVDDELNAVLVNPLGPGVRLHAVIDACHSGSVLDLEYRAEFRNGAPVWTNEFSRRPSVYKVPLRTLRRCPGHCLTTSIDVTGLSYCVQWCPECPNPSD